MQLRIKFALPYIKYQQQSFRTWNVVEICTSLLVREDLGVEPERGCMTILLWKFRVVSLLCSRWNSMMSQHDWRIASFTISCSITLKEESKQDFWMRLLHEKDLTLSFETSQTFNKSSTLTWFLSLFRVQHSSIACSDTRKSLLTLMLSGNGFKTW